MKTRIPVKVEPSASGHDLHIEWSSGEKIEIPYPELRFECPCANCVDEHTGKRTLRRDQVRTDVRPIQVNPVGRYALQIRWSDGHGTGMYHFDTLYSIGTRVGKTA